nr:helix-turn-helix domain-containing protein [uncultured Prevotella sp.]
MAKIAHTIVNEVPKRWLNSHEAERYLGCKERFLRNLRQTGQLRFYKVGGHILYEVNDLDKLVIKNKVV